MASHKPDPQVRKNIRQLVESIHDLKEWPLLDLLLSRGGEADWILPLHVARAFNTSTDKLWHAVTALACLHIGIVMVDDILDDTPNDAIRDYGTGKVANASQALQALAGRVIARADLPASDKLLAFKEVAEIGFGTAFGQSLDAAGSCSEESHWKALLNKSTPFYAGALRLGGYFTGASKAQLKALGDFGREYGILVQICDDIDDALASEVMADWLPNGSNTLIMYAELAEHEFKREFKSLRNRINEPGALEKAQDILIRSGALSYGAYVFMQSYKRAIASLQHAGIPNPHEIYKIITPLKAVLVEIFELAGVENPDSLFEQPIAQES